MKILKKKITILNKVYFLTLFLPEIKDIIRLKNMDLNLFNKVQILDGDRCHRVLSKVLIHHDTKWCEM